ncbi:PAS domain-containing sensor histidine kinase [Dechloromonas sp. HYN0024]|uniref:sensor histidine kinase n=1 Tax=Dechloromonas sp. HYN0024 TaxID=2231055 RepID=UPI000E42F5F1|nr:ATP-binding protein [Dechloromonas sp. HYN0024]AXS79111.1 histidine kinase [Dechloromonas sp. HYN0024]
MPRWLSSTWEANWRSFQYFNLYRLVLAVLLFLALVFPHDWTSRLNLSPSPLIFGVTGFYILATVAGLLSATYWQHRFNSQLSAQMLVDVLVVNSIMYQAGGVGSGLSVLLLVSLAAASLVGRGRLVLFYAALATLAILLTQIYGIFASGFDEASIVQAGFISAGFFATAVLARLLGQRVMINEELARRRGEALDNQIRISQRVVERVQDGVLIVAKGGVVSHSNPVARAMLGLPDAEGGVALIAPAPSLATALQAWDEGQGDDGLQFCGADGRDLQARFERTASTDGEVLVFLDDVGRIKERAQQLKLASLGRLTASIAHEIRNPLSAIGHAGELLREERRGDIQDRLLRILNENVIRLDRIVVDILELGRQSVAEPEQLQLDQFCADFVERFVATESLSPDVVVLEAVPLNLCFDRSHLHRVLWNLVSNALRHSSQGPGAVRIELCHAAHEGQVELHVIDDGAGVPEAVREQIFEPFFTTHTHGTGLGLFIARELCATNGASLALVSSAGGAHFIVAGRNDKCLVAESNGAQGAN